MTSSFLPSIFVPLVGLALPLVAITSFLIYVEEEQVN